MQTIYQDSLTWLEIDADSLHIHHQGRYGKMSFTEIVNVTGRAGATFDVANPQRIEEIIIDSLSRPAAFVLTVPEDGDGMKILQIINALRII